MKAESNCTSDANCCLLLNMLNYFSLHITFRNCVLAKFLCCHFLEILSNEHPGYKALLITTWHNKQRPMLNSLLLCNYSLWAMAGSLLHGRDGNASRKAALQSGLLRWWSRTAPLLLLKGPLLAKAIGKAREEKHIRPFKFRDTASEMLLSHR